MLTFLTEAFFAISSGMGRIAEKAIVLLLPVLLIAGGAAFVLSWRFADLGDGWGWGVTTFWLMVLSLPLFLLIGICVGFGRKAVAKVLLVLLLIGAMVIWAPWEQVNWNGLGDRAESIAGEFGEALASSKPSPAQAATATTTSQQLPGVTCDMPSTTLRSGESCMVDLNKVGLPVYLSWGNLSGPLHVRVEGSNGKVIEQVRQPGMDFWDVNAEFGGPGIARVNTYTALNEPVTFDISVRRP